MLSDVIVALATPPGRSALAVIRVSGKAAFEVAGRVVSGFSSEEPRRAVLAHFCDAEGTPIDEGLCLAFPGPASYTGEDVVELTCHGGLVTPKRVIAALEAAGARPAQPGEFTRRAVLNGKMDLIQAEAVGDLVDATAAHQARAALQQLDGGLSARLAALRSRLLELAALLQYHVDFPEEDQPPVPRSTLLERLEELDQAVDLLLRTAPAGQRLREGALVVLAGRPNSGKSSLFNALLGTERAIVTEAPGTTRDAIEAATEFDGWPVRLVDTAGLRDEPGDIERLGIEFSRRYLAAADAVLLCVEAGRDPTPEEEAMAGRELAGGGVPILLRTKADLAATAGPGLPVSSVTGIGLDEVRRVTADRAFGRVLGEADLEVALTRERHRTALSRAAADLGEARHLLAQEQDEAVLAAHHVQQAIHGLDALIGAVDVDEVLDHVFRTFCVGK